MCRFGFKILYLGTTFIYLWSDINLRSLRAAYISVKIMKLHIIVLYSFRGIYYAKYYGGGGDYFHLYLLSDKTRFVGLHLLPSCWKYKKWKICVTENFIEIFFSSLEWKRNLEVNAMYPPGRGMGVPPNHPGSPNTQCNHGAGIISPPLLANK